MLASVIVSRKVPAACGRVLPVWSNSQPTARTLWQLLSQCRYVYRDEPIAELMIGRMLTTIALPTIVLEALQAWRRFW